MNKRKISYTNLVGRGDSKVIYKEMEALGDSL